MREILFRGKRVDNGKWVYGLLCRVGDTYANIVDNDIKVIYSVLTKTIGQSTGMTDNNGKKIFEGDILKIINKYQSPFDDDTKEYTDITTDVVFFDDEGLCFSYGESPFLCVTDNVTAEYEVIDNIHDNPKLLNNFKNQ